ncbi:MAG TPA: cadherin repeat domain-containing protein, partial [Myxococcota bacterium]|nr:cadherin repeat domain-containing protein [Myxococcota bacterium]
DLTAARGLVEQIEQIDLRTPTTLTLAAVDVLRATDGRDTLVITGDADSTVDVLQDDWRYEGDVTLDDGTLARRIVTGDAALVIDAEVDTRIPPVLESSTLTVDEAAAPGTVVGTVEASDPDGVVVSIDPDLAAAGLADALAWDPVTATLSVLDGAALDYEDDPSLDIPVTITDDDGLVDEATLTLALNDMPEAPTFGVTSSTASVTEGAVYGTFVAVTLASDQDAGDVVTYSLSAGNEEGAFAIGETTGYVTVADGTWLDYETEPVIDLTIRATDTTGLWSERSLEVDLTDADNLTATFTVPFLTEAQSLTRSGGNGPAADILIDQSHVITWDSASNSGDSVLNFPGGTTILPDIESAGELDLYLNAEVDAGELNAWLPVEVTLEMPDQIPLGTSFDIDWSWELKSDAAVWGDTTSSSFTTSVQLQDLTWDINMGVLGRVNGGPLGEVVGPFSLDVPAEDFTGAPLDVLFDASDRPEEYSDDLKAYVDAIRSQFTQALISEDLSYDDYDPTVILDAEGDNLDDVITDWWRDVTGATSTSTPADWIYALLYIKDGSTIFDDGFNDRRVLATTTGEQTLLETEVDAASLLREVLPAVAGGTLKGAYLYWDMEFGPGKARVSLVYPCRTFFEVRVVTSQAFLLEVDGVTADLVFENGTRYDDVDVSEPLTGIVLPMDEDVNGDGKVNLSITYAMQTSVARFENKRYEVDWTTEAANVSVKTYTYTYNEFGQVTGQTLYNSEEYGPRYTSTWTFASPQPSWAEWSLGGLSTPEVTGRVQVTR